MESVPRTGRIDCLHPEGRLPPYPFGGRDHIPLGPHGDHHRPGRRAQQRRRCTLRVRLPGEPPGSPDRRGREIGEAHQLFQRRLRLPRVQHDRHSRVPSGPAGDYGCLRQVGVHQEQPGGGHDVRIDVSGQQSRRTGKVVDVPCSAPPLDGHHRYGRCGAGPAHAAGDVDPLGAQLLEDLIASPVVSHGGDQADPPSQAGDGDCSGRGGSSTLLEELDHLDLGVGGGEVLDGRDHVVGRHAEAEHVENGGRRGQRSTSFQVAGARSMPDAGPRVRGVHQTESVSGPTFHPDDPSTSHATCSGRAPVQGVRDG